MKSIPLAWLKPALVGGVDFVSLQKDHDDHRLIRELNIEPMRDVHDFADTAEIIEALDLVISVDTAVAHLAAAMGKPTWNLVRFNAYWPWMNETDTTVWYPAMKIYRQPALGDWAQPIKRIAVDLADMAMEQAA